jgi:hypothetical protein
MDKKNLVEVPAAELAKASSIPLGSLRSVLASLEKKNMIRTERQGTAKLRAIYEVLGTPRKSARSINGAVHDSVTPRRPLPKGSSITTRSNSRFPQKTAIDT